jgi:hypothetical protein
MQEHIVQNNHMTKALPCINTQKTAAKTISKGQQTLLNDTLIIAIIYQKQTSSSTNERLMA